MSMKAARTSRPNFSSPAVLCAAVRAGQLSTRKKTSTAAAATINTTNVNAVGQETRAEFDME